MTRMRVFIVFVMAITVGGAFAFATYNYVQNAAPAKTVTLPTKKVVVAASDLDIGAEIKSDDVRMVDWPANAVPAGAFNDPNEIYGRGLVLPVIQNEPILPMKLAGKDAGSGLPPAIPPGLRAVSVRVNEVIGVAGYVLPGTHVDVVATGDIFMTTSYPLIDVDRGGTIQGEIEALNNILELAVPGYQDEGGTYIVPGRGWISDRPDLLEDILGPPLAPHDPSL